MKIEGQKDLKTPLTLITWITRYSYYLWLSNYNIGQVLLYMWETEFRLFITFICT